MTKKIVLAVVLLLAVTVLFAACKKEEYKVSHTVPVGSTIVDVYEDKDGNEYVTNVDGDMIPVTTDAEGFFDSIEDLFTETTTKKSNKNDKTTTTTTTTTSTTTTTTNPSNDGSTTTTKQDPANDDTTTTTEKKEIVIDSQNKTPDSITWDEIVNAGKK